MRTKLYFVAALAATMLASCEDEQFVGENSPNVVQNESTESAINFGNGFKAITRANHVGADAASLLNKKFIVGGFKGTYDYSSGTPNVQDVTATGKVFDNYIVQWTANSAGTSVSNTSDWEYVGIAAEKPSGIVGQTQSIKYWDYTASQYDFIAYSTGDATIETDGTVSDAIAANKVMVTAITPGTATSSAYKLSGKAEYLAKCYIADMVTIYKDGTDGMKYQDEVQLTFRALASKVRMAIYETVPGYSVKDVKFYSDNSTGIDAGITNTDATLFTLGGEDKDHFYTAGTYTVKFPTIGKDKLSPKHSDYNKAHASFLVDGSGKVTTKTFGTLNLVEKEYNEAATKSYIGRTAATASFAGTAPYYQIAMPNEEGTVLELRIDYTLVSTDGSGEEIHVHGAKAYVPATYAKWKSNYAYTYIFKISDNTNGWTSTATTDPAGLYPITFDAIVLETEDFTQSTITNVATPSITTYQKNHVYNDGQPNKDEYDKSKGNIYIQVYWEGATPALRADLGSKGKLYKLDYADATEAKVMEALNLQAPEAKTGYTITGRNDLSLLFVSTNASITTIPGPDGNDIEVGSGTAAVFAAASADAGTYAYVYDTDTYTGDYYPIKPADWDSNWDKEYYTNAACTTHPASASFSAGTYYKKTSDIASYYEFTNSAPADWKDDATNPYYSDNDLQTQLTGTYESNHKFTISSDPGDWDKIYTEYYTDTNCSTQASATFAPGDYYKKVKCYRQCTVNNEIYGVKVIRIK
jgi:hypothetical protein